MGKWIASALILDYLEKEKQQHLVTLEMYFLVLFCFVGGGLSYDVEWIMLLECNVLQANGIQVV